MSTDLRKKVICAVVVFVNVINILNKNDTIFQVKNVPFQQSSYLSYYDVYFFFYRAIFLHFKNSHIHKTVQIVRNIEQVGKCIFYIYFFFLLDFFTIVMECCPKVCAIFFILNFLSNILRHQKHFFIISIENDYK